MIKIKKGKEKTIYIKLKKKQFERKLKVSLNEKP